MEKEILDNALAKLNELDALKCKILAVEVTNGVKRLDAQIQLQDASHKWNFNVEVKTKIVPTQIAHIRNHLETHGPYLLIADYITTQAKQILRSERIPYLDTAGNMFIQADGLYVFVDTGKTNRDKIPIGNRAFYKAGLKVVYQFLINPDYLNQPYRSIADQAQVTIDTVSRVIKGLLKEKYILRTNAEVYQYVDRKKLFSDWVTAFNKNLRPKLPQNNYRFLDKENAWKEYKLPPDTYWGGAVAAEIVTDHLIADKGIIYTGLPFPEVMKQLRLLPDEHGKIMLIEKFWQIPLPEKIVDHVLIYADLINDFNPRYLETANLIYQDYVEDRL